MKTMIDAWEQGHVFRAESEQFGAHDLLCVKSPGCCADERFRASVIKRDGTVGETLYLYSYAKDRVIHEYGTIADYFLGKSEREKAEAAQKEEAELKADNGRLEGRV